MRMTELLEMGGVTYHDGSGHHHARSGWIQVDCFACSPNSSKFRLGYNTSGKYWNCWTCGNYRLYDGLKGVLNLTDKDVKKLLFGEELEEGPRKEVFKKTGKYTPPTGVVPMMRQHREYLKARGFDPNELERLWGVKGIGIASNLQWRLFIPITYQGEEVSWTTRSLSEQVSTKYLTAKPEDEKIHHKDLLFGEDMVRHCVIVNEGPLDAIAVGPGAVATMGLGFSRAQLVRIAKYPVRVIAFDNEPDAQRRAAKLCDQLSVFDGSTFNARFSSGKDASRASKQEIRELRRKFLESEGERRI